MIIHKKILSSCAVNFLFGFTWEFAVVCPGSFSFTVMNWSDRVWVELALISYLIGFAYSVYSLASQQISDPAHHLLGDLCRIPFYDHVPV